MSILVRRCPTVILFLLGEWESCTQDFLLSGHCIDPWNLISRTSGLAGMTGRKLNVWSWSNICLFACLIILKLIRRILEFIIRRIKRLPSWALYCALYISVVFKEDTFVFNVFVIYFTKKEFGHGDQALSEQTAKRLLIFWNQWDQLKPEARSTLLVLLLLLPSLSGMKSSWQKHEYYWVRSLFFFFFFFRVPEAVDNLERGGTKELKRRLSVQKIEPQSDSINQAIGFLTSFDTDWLPQSMSLLRPHNLNL